jgi:alkylresorcinol/alkylpyrone synthase
MLSSVNITRVSTAQPEHSVDSAEAARRIGAVTGDARRVNAIARASRIQRRATALPADEIGALDSGESRNAVYKRLAPELALRVAREAFSGIDAPPVGCLVTSSCTGYMVPGWDVHVAQACEFPDDTVRVPLTQAGCSGGVLALATAAHWLRLHPGRSALAVSVELCSLAFQANPDPGNLVSALLFGDGAGAAVLQPGTDEGLRIVAGRSALVPCSREAIGFDLTDRGFFPRLALDLAEMLPEHTLGAAVKLLAGEGLSLSDLSFALLHPGGPRILDGLGGAFALPPSALRWSYESLSELGNTSSAAIFDVLRRYLSDDDAPRGWGIVAAFGPGVSIEMLLVHRS